MRVLELRECRNCESAKYSGVHELQECGIFWSAEIAGVPNILEWRHCESAGGCAASVGLRTLSLPRKTLREITADCTNCSRPAEEMKEPEQN